MPHKVEPTSFISEHSAEYVLVPAICDLLRHQFSWVLPLYFWASREGSSVGCSVGTDLLVRVIRVYARRPRVYGFIDSDVRVRLNQVLFEAANASQRYNVPVYAGVPVAASFDALANSPQCIWFRIPVGHVPEKPIDVELNSQGEMLSCSAGEIGPISPRDLVDDIVNSSEPGPWHVAMSNIRESRVADDGGGLFGFGGYKPFYVLFGDERR